MPVTPDTICRCGHAWAQHAQYRLDMIECDICDACEEFYEKE